ncbi:helix-turn-helix domain-containing protein [Cellulomonas fimi]|uniref:Helix-turn-helix domain-containing protein n=1 Tax=Cellulomonas fimi TaxID=1708 RepID=A0A7Y0LWD0_CELFI|nr:helix-turn-helix domain-containing protein [Cellulomonas fimi]NMR19175.1 helix-turn-helix domain-containing protein [Cellulomonas fimi]
MHEPTRTVVDDAARRPEFLTVAEVADRLRVTERFVRRLIATGELRAVRVGSRVVRVRQVDIDALLEPVHGPGSPIGRGPAAAPDARTSGLSIGRRVGRRER